MTEPNLGRRLSVVTGLTQCLPVGLIPEETETAFVPLYVVNNISCLDYLFIHTVAAQGIAIKE